MFKKLLKNKTSHSKLLKFRNFKGFTLIELLVIVAILGILLTITYIMVNGYREKARDAKRISDINQINLAISMYQLNNNGNPPYLGNLDCLLFQANENCYAMSSSPESWAILQEQLAPYLPQLPTDTYASSKIFNFLNKAFAQASDDNFVYVYHARARVIYDLEKEGRDFSPSELIESNAYSIFANKLEKTKLPFGYGLSVPSRCPYKDTKLCSYWNQCIKNGTPLQYCEY